MLASFKRGTVFVLAETDGDDDTETAGKDSPFVVGTGVSKAIIEDTGAADTVLEKLSCGYGSSFLHWFTIKFVKLIKGWIVTIRVLFKKILISWKGCQISCSSNIYWSPGTTKVF